MQSLFTGVLIKRVKGKTLSESEWWNFPNFNEIHTAIAFSMKM